MRHQSLSQKLATDSVVPRPKSYISALIYPLLHLHFPSGVCSEYRWVKKDFDIVIILM